MSSTKTEETIIEGAHILANQDPYLLKKEVRKFIADHLPGKDVTVMYSVSAVVVGANGHHAQTNLIVSCLIGWDTTETEFKTFRQRLQLLGKS